MAELDSTQLFSNNTSLLAAVVCTSIVIFLFQTFRQRKGSCPRYRYPPSLPSIPIFGSVLFMLESGENFHLFLTKKAKTLGNVFSFYGGSQYTVVLNDRKSIYEAFVRRAADFSDRTMLFNSRHYYNRDRKGIISKKYDENFKKSHQLILSVLKEFGFGQREMEDRILREVEEFLRLVADTKTQPFHPAQPLSMCTLNIIASILFGKRITQTDPALRQLHVDINTMAVNNLLSMNYCPPLRFLPRYQRAIKLGCQHLESQFRFIEDGMEQTLVGDNPDHSFVRGYIDRAGPGYDTEELKWICKDLLAAGSETTASTMKWAIVYLANNAEIQRRLHEEIKSVVPKERLPGLQDAAQMPYVEATLLEVMRVKTVVPLALLHRTTNDTQVAGFFVPKRTTIIPNLHAVHMDPDVWGDPENFRPERFLDESGCNVVGKDRIMSFSVGRRSCLGETLARQEAFLILSGLLHRFDILPPEGKTSVEVSPVGGITKAPASFLVRMIPRINVTAGLKTTNKP